jgi:Na+/H+ antiporter NhaC
MDWISLAPPIVAICLVLLTRNVVVSLLAGLWLSETLLAGFNPALGFLNVFDRIAGVFSSEYNTRLLLFCLVVGAFIALIRYSGGVSAFVERLVRSGTINSPRRAALLPFGLGLGLFVDTNLSLLTSGVAARGLFDRFKMSRARLAYIIDSTCAPVSSIVIINGWGAYLLTLLNADGGIDQPMSTLVNATVLNLYAIIAILLTFFVVMTGRTHGALAKAEQFLAKSDAAIEENDKPSKARLMILPMLTLIGGIFALLYWTGEGNILDGDGSRSLLWATSLAVVVAAILMIAHGRYTLNEATEIGFKGFGEIVPVTLILLVSISFGDSLTSLGTGPFVAQFLSESIPVWMAAPAIFLVAGFIAFTTGTSWGTFAIGIPIALPLAAAMGIPPSLLVAAVIGGGVFGDHCSPISDTTVVASLASGVDHIDHVRTQLPYALTGGALAILGYGLIGLFV